MVAQGAHRARAGFGDLQRTWVTQLRSANVDTTVVRDSGDRKSSVPSSITTTEGTLPKCDNNRRGEPPCDTATTENVRTLPLVWPPTQSQELPIPKRDPQTLLDGWVAKPVAGRSALNREHSEFDHQPATVGEGPPAERAATRDDEIRGLGNRIGLYLGVERVGSGGEHTEQPHSQSALAEKRFEWLPEAVSVGDRSTLDPRRHRRPRINHRSDRLTVLVQYPLAHLLHVSQDRVPIKKVQG